MSKKKITDLQPDQKNFNKHTEFGMHLLEKSMTKFGFVEAGVISEDGVIVSGNARQETAVNIGIEDVEIIKTDGRKAVYLQIEGLKSGTPEFHEMALALNVVPQKNIEFDFLVMADFPEIDFGDWGIDFDFDAPPVEEDESAVAETISKAKELQEKWQTASGQLWALGKNHRLLCGDSTKKEDVERLMQGEKAELCLTDPPYGLAITKKTNTFAQNTGLAPTKARKATKETWDDVIPDKAAFDLMFEHSENQIVFGANYFWENFYSSQCYIVWDKRGDLPDVPFAPTEFAWTSFGQMSKKYTVINHGFISDEKSDKTHPTQKPLLLFTPILEDFSSENDLIYEPFAGSGTTLIACEQLNRKCRAIEISAEYVAVCLERWANLTNQTPELIKT